MTVVVSTKLSPHLVMVISVDLNSPGSYSSRVACFNRAFSCTSTVFFIIVVITYYNYHHHHHHHRCLYKTTVDSRII